MKTLVVGNGPIPDNSGPIIDSYERVIRVNVWNNADESKIGKKCDIWSHGDKNFLNITKHFDYEKEWGPDDFGVWSVQQTYNLGAHPRTGFLTIIKAWGDFGAPVYIIGFGGKMVLYLNSFGAEIQRVSRYDGTLNECPTEIHNFLKEERAIDELAEQKVVIRI